MWVRERKFNQKFNTRQKRHPSIDQPSRDPWIHPDGGARCGWCTVFRVSFEGVSPVFVRPCVGIARISYRTSGLGVSRST